MTSIPKTAWGWPIKFPDDHIDVDVLEQARQEVDDVGDAAYETLSKLCESNDVDILAKKFNQLIADLTLNNRQSLNDPSLEQLRKQICITPEWLDWKTLNHGQLVFIKHSQSAAMGLLYFSLIGGFSAPKIVKVLDSTGYLTKSSRDATWRRLNETFYMVVECLQPHSLLVGQEGWLSVLRVRLLHSKARKGILSRNKNSSSSSHFDTTLYGQPINQEDMMATLLSFSINVIATIERIGSPYVLSSYDKQAYLHLWRYIGHVIGVNDKYNMCYDEVKARGAIESIVLHLLHPDCNSSLVASKVIHAVALRPPLRWSDRCHNQAARMLVGGALGDALNLKIDYICYIYLLIVFCGMCLMSWFIAPFITYDSKYADRIRSLLRLHVRSVLKANKEGNEQGSFSGKEKQKLKEKVKKS